MLLRAFRYLEDAEAQNEMLNSEYVGFAQGPPSVWDFYYGV